MKTMSRIVTLINFLNLILSRRQNHFYSSKSITLEKVKDGQSFRVHSVLKLTYL